MTVIDPFDPLEIPEPPARADIEDPAMRQFTHDWLPTFGCYFASRQQAWHAFWCGYLMGYGCGSERQPVRSNVRAFLRELRREMRPENDPLEEHYFGDAADEDER